MALLLVPLYTAARQQAREEDAITARALALVDHKLLAYATTEAEELIQPIAAMADRDAFVALALGRIRDQQGEYGDAVRYLKKATELGPSDPAAFLSLGEVYLRTDRDWHAAVAFKRAYDLARSQVDNDPKSANAYYLLGTAEQRLEHYEQAADTFHKALSLDPSNAMARYQLGVTRTFQKRWEEAVKNLTEAIDRDPEIAYAYYYRGIAAGALGRDGLVVEDMEHFLEMAPQAPEAAKAKAALTAALD